MEQFTFSIIFLYFFTYFATRFAVSLIMTTGQVNNGIMDKRVLQLEETVSDLKSQFQTQEQKQAAVLSSLLSKLSSTTNELNNLKTDFDHLETKYNASLLQLQEQEEGMTNMTSEMRTIKHNISDVQQSLDISAHNTCSGVEASFEAVEDGLMRTVFKNSTLILNKVTHNVGGGYSHDSGKFIAPVGGTYLFWAHIMKVNETDLVIELLKCGFAEPDRIVRIVRGYAPAGLRYLTASITSIVYVEKDEAIWFEVQSNSTIHGISQSSYGGTLLCSH